MGKVKRMAALLLTAVLLLGGLPLFSSAVRAEGGADTVVMGCYLDPGMMDIDENTREKSGYSYEYMQEIAVHAGWRYTYVYGTFSELLEKLADGQIDILPVVSATEERRETYLFSEYKMADEAFYLASPKVLEVGEDLRELNGLRVGSTEGYFQNTALEDFLTEHNLTCELVLYPSSEEKWQAVERGEVDLTIESSLLIQQTELYPVCNLGVEYPIYVAVAPNRTDVLHTLNAAQKELDEENPGFLGELQVKYFKAVPLFKSLSAKDYRWLNTHDCLRIGGFYLDDPLIYTAEDGSFKGVIPDYVSTMFENYDLAIDIEWKLYGSNDEALAALRSGEIDVIHPYYSAYNLAERDGVIISSAVYNSTMSILFLGEFTEATMDCIAAPVTRLGVYFTEDNYPEATIVPCETGTECIDKLLSGEVSCVLMNSNGLTKLANDYNENFNLKTLSTLCSCSFAALPENAAVIDIINRAAPFLTDKDLNAIEAYHFAETTSDITFQQFLKKNPSFWTIILSVVLVILLIAALLKRKSDVARAQQGRADTEAALREQLSRALSMAEAASKSKTEFLFHMSHDIRTPMNAILGYTEIGLRHNADTEKTRESLQKIKTAGEHLLSLINDILEMSRIEAGKVELREAPMDMRSATEGIIQMAESLATAKSIRFSADVTGLRNPYVYADELHINEVILNLISNAIKYTSEGGRVQYTVQQTGGMRSGKAVYRFEVADTGIGMSDKFQTHLFEAFSRDDAARASGAEGTGLGLSIVKRIVDLAGGTVWVKSKPGEGSVFTVELPLQVLTEEEAAAFEAESRASAAIPAEDKFTGKRVLLVEDNEMNREIATDILTEAGLTVEEAEDGLVALEAVKEKGVSYFDFILMDIQMPVMNGYESTKAIRALPGGDAVPIIALSANAFAEDKQTSLDAGMNGHVAKPIDVKVLFAALARFV